MTTCTIDGCESPRREGRYCWFHWARSEAFGDPLATRRFYRHDPRIRILGGIREDAETGCWNWVHRLDDEGYAQTQFMGVNMKAHRAVYILFRGAIPAETLDHLCRNRACVNPEHLDPVSMRENTLRGDTAAARNAAKTHCPQGHEYSPENTYITLTPHGGRRCRICTREHIARSKAKRRRLLRDSRGSDGGLPPGG